MIFRTQSFFWLFSGIMILAATSHGMAMMVILACVFWFILDRAKQRQMEKKRYATQYFEKMRRRSQSVRRSRLCCIADGQFHFRTVCQGGEVRFGYFVDTNGMPWPYFFSCQERAFRALRLFLAIKPLYSRIAPDMREGLEREIRNSGLLSGSPTTNSS